MKILGCTKEDYGCKDARNSPEMPKQSATSTGTLLRLAPELDTNRHQPPTEQRGFGAALTGAALSLGFVTPGFVHPQGTVFK